MLKAADERTMCCASCGIAEVDDIKLKMCNGGCDLVKYCSDDCQTHHREHHEEECKKRVAELRDRDLFTQPDSSCFGECPICCLPLSLESNTSTMMSCCSKLICNGCNYANKVREFEAGLERRCVYCREPLPKSDEEHDKSKMKRIKKNCPVAIREEGKRYFDKEDYETALEYFTKAAELGDAEAHYNLSVMYHEGRGVGKEMKKFFYHAEQAAIGGHPSSRHNLGYEEKRNGRFGRARKHWIIAANLGFHTSLFGVRELYADGHASKEDYFDALRAYQAAIDATKSPEREKAEIAKAKKNLLASKIIS